MNGADDAVPTARSTIAPGRRSGDRRPWGGHLKGEN